METIQARIGALRLVPVIVIRDAEAARPLGEALQAAGLPCAEITFRTAAAAEAIRRIAGLAGMLTGAGTVLTLDQLKAALDAGAQFIVSPGLNPKVAEYCVSHKIPVFPGVATPTEIEWALSFGLEAVKFFPAEALGGVKTLKAVSAPYAQVKFVPTGGIGPENLRAYLDLPNVLACGGSWMVKDKLIEARNWTEVARLTREAVALTRK